MLVDSGLGSISEGVAGMRKHYEDGGSLLCAILWPVLRINGAVRPEAGIEVQRRQIRICVHDPLLT